MNPNLKAVRHSSAEVRVSAEVTGFPDVKQSGTITIAPDHLSLRYSYRDGRWVCNTATLSGSRVLKADKDGNRRVSNTGMSHKREWHTWGSADMAEKDAPGSWGPTPDELRTLVNDLRPTGTLGLPQD